MSKIYNLKKMEEIKKQTLEENKENGITYIYLILPIHLRLNLIYIAPTYKFCIKPTQGASQP